MSEQIISILESFRSFWDQSIQFLPQLIIGICLFVAGWFIAALLRNIIIRIFKLVHLDAVTRKAGIDEFLQKGGIQHTTINILANSIFWFIILALTLAVLHSFGLDSARILFDKLMTYTPNLVVAVFILIFGTLFARFVQGATYTYLSNIQITGAGFISNVVLWVLLFLVIALALDQLSIGGQLLVAAFEIAFGGLCLGLAISFGLAGKEWATQILEKLWRHSR